MFPTLPTSKMILDWQQFKHTNIYINVHVSWLGIRHAPCQTLVSKKHPTKHRLTLAVGVGLSILFLFPVLVIVMTVVVGLMAVDVVVLVRKYMYMSM